jgi:hypothetical protein
MIARLIRASVLAGTGGPTGWMYTDAKIRTDKKESPRQAQGEQILAVGDHIKWQRYFEDRLVRTRRCDVRR